jgi:hypothetical protein
MNTQPYQTSDENHLRVAVQEEQVSVAPGNEAEIHVGVINENAEPEDVNISVLGAPAGWIMIDTPMVHLPPGQARQVTVAARPPNLPEGLVGQYPLTIQAIGQNGSRHLAEARSVLTVAAYESRGPIGVLLGSTQFAVFPDSTVSIPILLQNRSARADTFQLHIAGIPSDWISTSSALSTLEPSESKEVLVTIHVPPSPQAVAGRMPFLMQFVSQSLPGEKEEIGCTLVISAFSQFSASLEPATLAGGQFGQVTIHNEGNTVETYGLSFQSPGNVLIFEKAVQVQGQGLEVETAYMEIPPAEAFQVPAGERGVYPFRARLWSRPTFGGEQTFPFTVRVASSEQNVQELSARVNESAWLPIWFLPAMMMVAAVLFLLLFSFQNFPTSALATQTASSVQDQASLAGAPDADSDGLTNTEESQLGTNQLMADTDADTLLDGEEVKIYQTNPLAADTDADGLTDGAEARQYTTDPRNADTDADLLNDGDEIEAGTDPKVADIDQDGLGDGTEISLRTDPHQQDTDRDGLLDGQENQTCPGPLTPDSDADGLIDANDRDPCNATNPALTATAIAGAPTPAPPTQAQPTIVVVVPASTLPPTSMSVQPTNPPLDPFMSVLLSLQGVVVFETNRDGNSEIYTLNLADQSQVRLTNNNTAQEVQPALAPDGVQVAYVSNQDGNNEIYLGGTDGRAPLNLTHNAADDQQPAWSPDGNWIAFTTNRDGNQEVYVMSSDGSQFHNLTKDPADDFAAAWFTIRGVFGTEDWIAFTSTRDGNQEIYRIRADGMGLTNLTNNPANDYAPAGAASGQILAFVTERDGNPEIYTMNVNGGALTNITSNPARDLEPAFNSNGSWIAFSTDREGNLEVYVVRSEGDTAYNLTRNSGQDGDPDW